MPTWWTEWSPTPTAVIHAAAESHVDRSIDDPGAFLRTNVIGTQVVLEASPRARRPDADAFDGRGLRAGRPDDSVFDEDARAAPASPYAASKAAADLLCSAYVVTYGAPVTVVRGTNAFGPRQIERVMPTFAICALEGAPVPVYGDGQAAARVPVRPDWVASGAHGARSRRARRASTTSAAGSSSRTWSSRDGSARWPACPSR